MKLLMPSAETNCLVGSLAMLLDLPYKNLAKHFDGWLKVWPSLPKPYCYRGFHIEEYQYILRDYGLCLIPYYPGFEYRPKEGVTPLEVYLDKELDKVMTNCDGIIIGLDSSGHAHAVAWNHKEKLVYDPRGYITGRESIQLECFYAIGRS